VSTALDDLHVWVSGAETVAALLEARFANNSTVQIETHPCGEVEDSYR
jgi:hypothetical protein